MSVFLDLHQHVANFQLLFPQCLFSFDAVVIYVLVSLLVIKACLRTFTEHEVEETKSLPDFSEFESLNMNSRSTQVMNSRLSSHRINPKIVANYDISEGFLKFHQGNIENARKAYAKTLEWRADNGLDDILTTHQSHFEDILRLYPHAIHGKSKDGVAVLYELIGKARPKEMSKLGVTSENFIWHFILRNEFVFKNVFSCIGVVADEVKENQSASDLTQGQIMTVIDLKGICIADVTGDVISFIKKSSEIMDTHYPGRVKRLIFPRPYFEYVTSRVLPESVKKKIAIMGGTQGLQEFIDISQLPLEYGGSGGLLGKSPEHLAFERLPEDWLKKAVTQVLVETTTSQLAPPSQIQTKVNRPILSIEPLQSIKETSKTDSSSGSSSPKSSSSPKDLPTELNMYAHNPPSPRLTVKIMISASRRYLKAKKRHLLRLPFFSLHSE